MDGMDIGEYDNYWETQRFFDAEELDSWGFDDAFSGYYDSSSPDGAASSATAKKSISQERERRRKFNEKLYTLRSLVPSITKMDKASIVKDAIDYIADLQNEEKKLVAELSELEVDNSKTKSIDGMGPHVLLSQPEGRKEWRTAAIPRTRSPINVTEVKVRDAGDGTSVVSITCARKKDTMGRLCGDLESLRLNIVAANVTSFSGNILHTLLVQTHEMESGELKRIIEAALCRL